MSPEATSPTKEPTEVGTASPAEGALDGRTATGTRRLALVRSARGAGMVALLVIAVLGGLLFVHGFATTYNIETVLRNAGFLGFVAVGMTFIVATGNFVDLSVVAQIAAAGLVTTTLEKQGLPIALLGGFGTCLAFAAVNWFGVSVMRANCVIVTLGVETAGMGVVQYASNGASYTGSSGTLSSFLTSSIGPIPTEFIILVALVAATQLLIKRVRLGYAIRAVGANRVAAALAGVRTDAAMGVAFVAVSLGAALTGIALAGYNSGALSNMGQGYDFNSLAAVVVGGNSLLGGEGWPLRTLVGVLFVEVLNNLVVLTGLPYTWQQVVLGVVVIASVAVDATLRRRQTA